MTYREDLIICTQVVFLVSWCLFSILPFMPHSIFRVSQCFLFYREKVFTFLPLKRFICIWPILPLFVQDGLLQSLDFSQGLDIFWFNVKVNWFWWWTILIMFIIAIADTISFFITHYYGYLYCFLAEYLFSSASYHKRIFIFWAKSKDLIWPSLIAIFTHFYEKSISDDFYSKGLSLSLIIRFTYPYWRSVFGDSSSIIHLFEMFFTFIEPNEGEYQKSFAFYH